MRAAKLVQIGLLGLFTAIGLLATVAVAVDWLQGLDTWFWEESTCTIESARATERPAYGDSTLQVSYRYDHRGDRHYGDAYRHGYSGSEQLSETQSLASRYPAGMEVRCWVDPDEPGDSYLRRSDLWDGFWILAPLVFVAVGAGSLWLLYGPGSRTDEREPAEQDPISRRARPGLGLAAGIVLSGVFFLFGAGLLIPFFVRPALQVVEARSWRELPCEIVSSGVRSHPGDDGATYSVDVLYSYEIDGREYRSSRYQFIGGSSSGHDSKARIVDRLPAGAGTACYVNPDNPFEAVIERGFTGDYLFGLVPLLFAAIGIGGLVFAIGALRSARRDAARPSWTEPTSPGEAPGRGWSSSLSSAAPTGEPIVLEPALGPVGKLGCAIGVSLFWNGFISIFVWQLVKSWRAGNPEWFTTIIVAPFALIGLLLLCSIPHGILALLNPRPRVHLSPGALRVGESAQIEWAFKGFGSRIQRLKIWLDATETRTRLGESSGSIETRPLDTPAIVILERGREQPIEHGAVSFTIPAATPPSSEGEVSVTWKLRLHGDIAYWPDVNEAYVVHLASTEG